MFNFAAFLAIAQFYYVKEAYRVNGWKPFTAQIFSAALSTVVDFLLANAQFANENGSLLKAFEYSA